MGRNTIIVLLILAGVAYFFLTYRDPKKIAINQQENTLITTDVSSLAKALTMCSWDNNDKYSSPECATIETLQAKYLGKFLSNKKIEFVVDNETDEFVVYSLLHNEGTNCKFKAYSVFRSETGKNTIECVMVEPNLY